jgi:hypothetical protein
MEILSGMTQMWWHTNFKILVPHVTGETGKNCENGMKASVFSSFSDLILQTDVVCSSTWQIFYRRPQSLLASRNPLVVTTASNALFFHRDSRNMICSFILLQWKRQFEFNLRYHLIHPDLKGFLPDLSVFIPLLVPCTSSDISSIRLPIVSFDNRICVFRLFVCTTLILWV